MATSYSHSNTKLGKPAVADRNWDQALNANADLLDALAPIGGLCVTTLEVPSASLNVQVAPGQYQKSDGTVGTFAGAASFALGPGQTSVLFLTDAGILSDLDRRLPHDRSRPAGNGGDRRGDGHQRDRQPRGLLRRGH